MWLFELTADANLSEIAEHIPSTSPSGTKVTWLDNCSCHCISELTSEIISSRIVQESKFLMKQTNWNISEIAFSLGFEEVAHFSNFFKKQTNIFPMAYRDKII